MRKILAALTLFLTSCVSQPTYTENKAEMPQFNIVPLEQLAFDSNEYNLPSSLESFIKVRLYMNKIKNRKQFKQNVYETAQKLGYSQQTVSCLEPLQAIRLAADIVSAKLDYYKSFEEKDERDEHGLKYIDEIFAKGKTYCVFYTKLTSAIFEIFKKTNPKLKNIYIVDKPLQDASSLYNWKSAMEKARQKNPQTQDEYFQVLFKYAPKDLVYQNFHDWNTIFVYSPSQLQIAMIDTTAYDTEKRAGLDASGKGYVDTSKNKWKERFSRQLEQFEILKKCMKID